MPSQPDRDRSRPEKAKNKPLRKAEAEHIDWVTNLVNIPNDPDLKTRRGG